MSGPKPISGSHAVYYGHPLVVWRAAAMRAHRALQENPNDAGAQRTLQGAQQVLREHVALLDQMNQSANARDMYSAAEYADANKAGPWQAGVANAVDAFSLGSGDEIAGLAASMVPGGMTGQQARDRYRSGMGQLRTEQPLASLAGQVGGAVALGAGTAGALPGLARTLAAGGVLGGSQGAAMGAGALIGGGEGAARGLLSEGDLSQRLGAAGTQGMTGAALGAVGTGVVNRLRLRHARRIAQDAVLARRAAQAASGEAVMASETEPAIPAIQGNVAPVAAEDNLFTRAAQRLHPNDLQAQERAIEKMQRAANLRNTPSGVRPEMPAVQAGDPAETIPGFIRRQSDMGPPAAVGEAQMPGSALHDVAGRPIAGTEVMPHDPANAARAAHAQVMAATGDAEAAKLAARNAAGMARGATAEPSPAAVDPVHRAMAMDAVLKSEPNIQNQEALMQLLGTMSPLERAGITPYIQRTYPVWWRLLTGGGQ